jgi:hypothetical protein
VVDHLLAVAKELADARWPAPLVAEVISGHCDYFSAPVCLAAAMAAAQSDPGGTTVSGLTQRANRHDWWVSHHASFSDVWFVGRCSCGWQSEEQHPVTAAEQHPVTTADRRRSRVAYKQVLAAAEAKAATAAFVHATGQEPTPVEWATPTVPRRDRQAEALFDVTPYLEGRR